MTYESAEVSGMPTLMRDGQPVAYLDGGKLHVSPLIAEQAFAALARVHAPDEATIERLAEAISSYAHVLDDPEQVRWCVEDVLAALADTSAQTRHTAGEAAGGGEHG